MQQRKAQIAAITVAGDKEGRVQQVLDALGRQEPAVRLEAVVVDLGTPPHPQLRTPPGLEVKRVSVPENAEWGKVRFAGFEQSEAPIVAFLEDHCIPTAGWARALLKAYEQPWAAVSYAFMNGSPDTYVYRAMFLAEYGAWASPVPRGASHLLPCNNVSYRKEALLSLGDDLEWGLANDFLLHEQLRARGLPMCIEPEAKVLHQSNKYLKDCLGGNFRFARVIASKRSALMASNGVQRICYGLACLPLVPPLRIARLFRSLKGRPSLWSSFVACLPVIWLVYASAAAGESIGFLFGEGRTQKLLRWAELRAPRGSRM
jgi:hypothetical protein